MAQSTLRNGGAVPIPIRNNYALTYVIDYVEVGSTTNNSYFGNENAITFTDTYPARQTTLQLLQSQLMVQHHIINIKIMMSPKHYHLLLILIGFLI